MGVLAFFQVSIFCLVTLSTALQVTHNDISNAEFPLAPGFTYNRDAYVVGAYAIIAKSVIRISSLPPSEVLQSISAGHKSKIATQIGLDQLRGKKLYCVFSTEELIPVSETAAHDLRTIDCPMSTALTEALRQPVFEQHMSLIAVTEGLEEDEQWEPVIKAKITLGVFDGKMEQRGESKRRLLVCSSSIHADKSPYVLEWVNWQFLYGADHVLLYLGDASMKVPDLVAPYVRSGLVTLRRWQLSEIQTTARSSHQIALVNDCLYSAIDDFTWASSHDLDEYIFAPDPSNTLAGILDKHAQDADVGALTVKTWICDANDDPWEAPRGEGSGELPWAGRKARHTGTYLGRNQELLTFKEKKYRHNRVTDIRYAKWFAKTTGTQNGGVHAVQPLPGMRVEVVSESVLHFKHYYDLSSNRSMPGNCKERGVGWCAQDGEPDSVLDTAMFDLHGKGFLQRWPHGFANSKKNSNLNKQGRMDLHVRRSKRHQIRKEAHST